MHANTDSFKYATFAFGSRFSVTEAQSDHPDGLASTLSAEGARVLYGSPDASLSHDTSQSTGCPVRNIYSSGSDKTQLSFENGSTTLAVGYPQSHSNYIVTSSMDVDSPTVMHRHRGCDNASATRGVVSRSNQQGRPRALSSSASNMIDAPEQVKIPQLVIRISHLILRHSVMPGPVLVRALFKPG